MIFCGPLGYILCSVSTGSRGKYHSSRDRSVSSIKMISTFLFSTRDIKPSTANSTLYLCGRRHDSFEAISVEPSRCLLRHAEQHSSTKTGAALSRILTHLFNITSKNKECWKLPVHHTNQQNLRTFEKLPVHRVELCPRAICRGTAAFHTWSRGFQVEGRKVHGVERRICPFSAGAHNGAGRPGA